MSRCVHTLRLRSGYATLGKRGEVSYSCDGVTYKEKQKSWDWPLWFTVTLKTIPRIGAAVESTLVKSQSVLILEKAKVKRVGGETVFTVCSCLKLHLIHNFVGKNKDSVLM